jgi:TPR repeat protein
MGSQVGMSQTAPVDTNEPKVPEQAPGADIFPEYIRLYNETKGVIDDRHFTILRKAATAGHKEAQATLGIYLLTLKGATEPKALKEATVWLQKVEKEEAPEFDGPAFMLGLCYLNGMGVGKDAERAGKLLKRAAKRGTSDMKIAYATFLLETNGDKAEAKTYLEQVSKDETNPDAKREAIATLKTIE